MLDDKWLPDNWIADLVTGTKDVQSSHHPDEELMITIEPGILLALLDELQFYRAVGRS